MTHEATPTHQIASDTAARLAANWRKIAGEDLGIEGRGAMTYAVGSELAVLRLFYAYRNDPAPSDARFSETRGAWVFALQKRIDPLH